MVVGDFDGDGRLDLAVNSGDFTFQPVEGGVRDTIGAGGLQLLPGQGDGTFRALEPVVLGDFFPGHLLTGDFDGDTGGSTSPPPAARSPRTTRTRSRGCC